MWGRRLQNPGALVARVLLTGGHPSSKRKVLFLLSRCQTTAWTPLNKSSSSPSIFQLRCSSHGETPSQPHPGMILRHSLTSLIPSSYFCLISSLTSLLQISNFAFWIAFNSPGIVFCVLYESQNQISWLSYTPTAHMAYWEASCVLHPVVHTQLVCVCQVRALVVTIEWYQVFLAPCILIIMLHSPSIYLLMNYINLLPDVKLVFHSMDKPNLVVMYHTLSILLDEIC